MKEFAFERAAMRGDPMPDGLTGAEQLLFQGLSLLYARLHMGAIDRDMARREKVKLVQQYENAAFDYALWARTAALWKTLEAPMAAFREKSSVENAKRCMELLYGVTIAWKEEP